jgi:hypothetical protein
MGQRCQAEYNRHKGQGENDRRNPGEHRLLGSPLEAPMSNSRCRPVILNQRCRPFQLQCWGLKVAFQSRGLDTSKDSR